MSEIVKENKRYLLEINCTVEIRSCDMPGEEIEMDIRNKIRTKVFCNRENLELLEIGSKIYKGETCEDDKED